MNKQLSLPIIVVVVLLAGGAFAWSQFMRPAGEQAPPTAPEEKAFMPDETIGAELCRRVITRAQLLEIMGDETTLRETPLRDIVNGGEFVFVEESRDPGIGTIDVCSIFPPNSPRDMDMATLEVVRLGLPTAKVMFLPPTLTFEELKRDIPAGMETKEIEGIGERAFLVSTESAGIKLRLVVFWDPGVDQAIQVVGMNIGEETVTNLARQVEKNLR